MILQRASKDSYLKVPSRNSILSIVEFLTFALHALRPCWNICMYTNAGHAQTTLRGLPTVHSVH